MDWMVVVQFAAGARDFPYSTASGLALGPTQPFIQWVPGVFPPGVKFTYVHRKKSRLHCGFVWLKIEIAVQL
jgi:hypothetical protein